VAGEIVVTLNEGARMPSLRVIQRLLGDYYKELAKVTRPKKRKGVVSCKLHKTPSMPIVRASAIDLSRWLTRGYEILLNNHERYILFSTEVSDPCTRATALGFARFLC